MTPKLDLQKIRTRCDRATPGPWHHTGSYKGTQNQQVSPADDNPDATVMTDLGSWVASVFICVWKQLPRDARLDADFIANARTDIPALLDWIERVTPAMRSALKIHTGPFLAEELQALLAEIGAPPDEP